MAELPVVGESSSDWDVDGLREVSKTLIERAPKAPSVNFELFKYWTWHFLDYFGFRETWNIEFECMTTDDTSPITESKLPDGMASVSYNTVSRTCVFQFARDCDYTRLFGIHRTKITVGMVRREIARAAFHETLELMLAGFYYGFRPNAKSKNHIMFDPNVDDSQRHYVIRMLENTVFPVLYDSLLDSYVRRGVVNDYTYEHLFKASPVLHDRLPDPEKSEVLGLVDTMIGDKKEGKPENVSNS